MSDMSSMIQSGSHFTHMIASTQMRPPPTRWAHLGPNQVRYLHAFPA